MKSSDNTLLVLNLLIKELQIPVTRKSIAEELLKHPDFPSLKAISDTLDTWSVTNSAYQVTVNELIETEIPVPFIACFKQGNFVLVKQINKKQVTISNGIWNSHILEVTEFEENYQGTILALQKDDSSGEVDYPTKRRREIINNLRVPFIGLVFTVIIILLLYVDENYINSFSWRIGFLTIFKSIGLATSVLLLIQSIDANNPLVKRLCGGEGKQNCNSILTSKAAKISEEISWSEVGFFYFAGSWLVLLLNTENGHLMQILAFLNLLSLPYTVYSIYYQWRVAKQWCVFCCAIQVTLWLEFFAFLPYVHFPPTPIDFHAWGCFSIGLLVPILIWVSIKPLLFNSIQLQPLRQSLYRFKYNKELFQNILHKEGKYGLLSEENTIVIGNREANTVITVVSSPFCNACSGTHKLLDELINSRDDIKLQFVFLTRLRSRDFDRKVLSHFMSLKFCYGDLDIKKALNDWYEQKEKDYDSWQINYPVNDAISNIDALTKQKAWCKMANVNSTPTLFVNGRRLPEMYWTEDIKYII